MTVDEWLASNTFECSRLAARLTSAQCEANNERALSLQFPGQLTPCILCGGEQDMGKVKEQQRVKRPYNRKAKPGEAEVKSVPVVDGEPQEFIDHSAPIAQEDLERAADRHLGELEDGAPDAELTHRLGNTECSPASASMRPAADADMRSLLYFLGRPQDTPPQPPGFFVDFTGHEQLLAHLQGLSDDINSDMIALLTSLLDGELCRRAPAAED